MAFRDSSLLHTDKDLTNIAVEYASQQDRYIGSSLFPPVTVPDKSDKYLVMNRDVWGRKTDDVRARGGSANELPPMTFSRDSYYTIEHALVDIVPREDQQDTDGLLDALGIATERLTNTIMLNRELAFVNQAFTAANFNSSYTVTLAGTQQWNDFVNSNPVSDLKTGVDAIFNAIGMLPSDVFMGRPVYRKLEDHPDILERMRGAPLAVTTGDVMQRVFGLPPITIAQAQYVSSAYNQTEVLSNFVSKDCLLVWNPAEGNRRAPAFGYEFVRPVGSDDGEQMPVERWYDIDRKGDKVRISREYQSKFIVVDGNGLSNGAGYLIKSAVA
jgi:hypothetical protein